MSFSIYYPGSCEAQVPDYVCDGCPNDNIEHGRIRSAGFIHSSYLATLIADPDSAPLWTAGVVDKKIIIIAKTAGAYDGGAPVLGPGYGDEVERLIGYNHTVTFKDPNYKANAAFYNAIKRTSQYYFFYRTETQVHISDKVVRATPKAPVGDDITSEVVWDTEVKWFSPDLPAPFNAPAGIFDECFQYEEA